MNSSTRSLYASSGRLNEKPKDVLFWFLLGRKSSSRTHLWDTGRAWLVLGGWSFEKRPCAHRFFDLWWLGFWTLVLHLEFHCPFSWPWSDLKEATLLLQCCQKWRKSSKIQLCPRPGLQMEWCSCFDYLLVLFGSSIQGFGTPTRRRRENNWVHPPCGKLFEALVVSTLTMIDP